MRRILCLVAIAGCGPGNPVNPSDGGTGCPAGEQTFGGVCLTAPTVAAARTPCGDVTEFCDPKAMATPNLACLGMAKMHPPMPDKVALTGFVHPFSSGKSNSAVTIQLFAAADLLAGKDPSTATPIQSATVTFDPSTAMDPTQFRACDVDPMVGCVPTAPSACVAPTCDDGLNGRPDGKKYCHLVSGQPTCSDRLRWEPRFTIPADGSPAIPTNTSLVIRSSGMNGQADQTWAVLVAWNVFFASDDPACADGQATDCIDSSTPAKPKYQLNVNVLSESDYTNIPVAAGLSSGIAIGEGAVAGEVHDCDNVRLANVQVGTSPTGDRLTYFNGNPYDTLPDSGRAATGTDRLGLYSALNVVPGKIDVETAGLVGGNVVTVGKFTAIVYPNSV